MSEEWENALMYNDLEAIREIANKLYEENKQLIKDADYWIDRAYEYKHKLEAIRSELHFLENTFSDDVSIDSVISRLKEVLS